MHFLKSLVTVFVFFFLFTFIHLHCHKHQKFVLIRREGALIFALATVSLGPYSGNYVMENSVNCHNKLKMLKPAIGACADVFSNFA